MIVEVEAYVGETDPACHAAAGPTARNAPMYGEAGHAYVYLNYGIHHLFNVVTEPPGRPCAVLVRALAPIEGLDLMRRRRGGPGRRLAPDNDLCRGPGNLTKALGIGPAENRADLAAPAGRVWIEDRGLGVGAVSWGPRVGIRVGLERPWRAFVRGHPAVSRGTAATGAG